MRESRERLLCYKCKYFLCLIIIMCLDSETKCALRRYYNTYNYIEIFLFLYVCIYFVEILVNFKVNLKQSEL